MAGLAKAVGYGSGFEKRLKRVGGSCRLKGGVAGGTVVFECGVDPVDPSRHRQLAPVARGPANPTDQQHPKQKPQGDPPLSPTRFAEIIEGKPGCLFFTT